MESFLVRFLQEFDSMEWLTVGLLVFAGVQVLVPIWHEQQRRRERESEERARKTELDRVADQNFQIVWAEHFRLDALASEWRKLDLVELVLMGAFDPSQLLPQEWSPVMTALSRISIEAGFLGAVALSQGHEVSRDAARLARMLEILQERHPGRSPAEIATLARTVPGLQEYEQAVKDGAQECASLLWDALNQAPRAHISRELNLRDELTSQVARQAVDAINRRSRENAKLGALPRDAG